VCPPSRSSIVLSAMVMRFDSAGFAWKADSVDLGDRQLGLDAQRRKGAFENRDSLVHLVARGGASRACLTLRADKSLPADWKCPRDDEPPHFLNSPTPAGCQPPDSMRTAKRPEVAQNDLMEDVV